MRTIILAGGVGTRLWPLSREYFPKQFIPMDGKSLFQKTCERALKFSPEDKVWVVTNEIHQYLVRNQVEELGIRIPGEHVLTEPEQKNTLPAIAWAMRQIKKEDDKAVAIVFPSDHLLGDDANDQIRGAVPLAEEYLVTFGIKPTCPHTGYGYINPGKPLAVGFIVDQFREKPDEKTAAGYVEKGYLWNSGMFLLSVPVFFRELRKFQPRLFAAFSGKKMPGYGTLDSISIDYGLLERSKKVAVVPLGAEWNDLGTFAALYDVSSQSRDGNVGSAEFIASRGTYVHAPGKHVGVIGVENLVVVDTADALLVCDRRSTEQVKDLVSRLKEKDSRVTRFHRQVHRPWGSYTVLEDAKGHKIKRVTVKPGQKLSLQLHHHRSEHWVVVSGTAEVELNGETRLLRQGESTFVRSGIRHRLRNPGVIPLEVIEVQLGEYLEEDDIVRYEDDYGRE